MTFEPNQQQNYFWKERENDDEIYSFMFFKCKDKKEMEENIFLISS